jgi:hypothetical protein
MSIERPALSAVIDRSGFTPIDTAATGTTSNEQYELQQAPPIAAAQFAGAERGVPILDSVSRWENEGTILSDEVAFGFGRGADGTREDRTSAKGFPWSVQRLRIVLFMGVALAIFGLGSLGGVIAIRLMTPTPAPSMTPQIDASAQVSAQTLVSAPTRVETSNDPVPGSDARKVIPAPASTRPDPIPIALPKGIKNLPHLVPVPETKPATIQGWKVREVSGGFASLVGPQGTLRVASGEIVPGLGRVESIVRWGNRWLVSTRHGIIASE